MTSMVSELESKVSEYPYCLYLEWKYIFTWHYALCTIPWNYISHNSGWQSGSFLRKQCVNKRFQLGVFGEFHRG